ncbi:PREDICTED: synaptic vesicular amine transporter-like isoform X2 [Priapulus caudatus]|uniref:Synaptic vesicular amine transporter-like isoform X2 n=1 Tax=Priapulus caudatus TaxID=37621 RepID=A0ABM1DQJ9_PRICU|nr:PREDICTED: synaptic vesicular amine transporter-like isoform X2 [Priapulus caudatus]
MVLFIVFLALLLDNMLYTVVVPIIPDYLYTLEHHREYVYSNDATENPSSLANSTSIRSHNATIGDQNDDLGNENSQVGWLFSSKAIVQLFANLLVGPLTNRIGYTIPMFVGVIVLIISTMIFSVAQSYGWLFFARSVQGIGSACSAIAGLGMLADRYKDDKERSQAMGIALGGMAAGVLVGYPFGSLMYDFVGQTAPFIFIIFLGLLGGAIICVSTFAMAILETTLPIWLMETMQPPTWQLGTVFLPDSIGYLLGTNLFGIVAFKLGRWICAMSAVLIIGCCLVMIPFATQIAHLLIPHFGVGLGIGIVDSSIIPLLGHIVDVRYVSIYGSVYAIGQTASCLAYSVGPGVGGELNEAVGFSWVMRIVAILNFLVAPLCFFLRRLPESEESVSILMNECPIAYSTETQQPIYVTTGHTRLIDEDSD